MDRVTLKEGTTEQWQNSSRSSYGPNDWESSPRVTGKDGRQGRRVERGKVLDRADKTGHKDGVEKERVLRIVSSPEGAPF